MTTLIAIVSTISMMAYRSYDRTASHRSAARETVALLRNAQVKAVSEAATYECRFTSTKLDIHSPSGAVMKTMTLGPNLRYVATGTSHSVAHGFSHSSTSGKTNCYFYPRGTATGGVVGIQRADTAAEYDVAVEALTARVSYCADPTPSNPC